MERSAENITPLWFGITASSMLDLASYKICSKFFISDFLDKNMPAWVTNLLLNFKGGLANNCHIMFTAPTRYNDNLAAIGKLISAFSSIMKGVVVAGYSQGGTVAVDASLF